MNESLRKVAGLLMVPQASHYTLNTHRLCEALLIPQTLTRIAKVRLIFPSSVFPVSNSLIPALPLSSVSSTHYLNLCTVKKHQPK